MTEKNNDKDLDRVARKVMLILENESFGVVVNSLGSALITVFWNVYKKNSKNMIEIFCDNFEGFNSFFIEASPIANVNTNAIAIAGFAKLKSKANKAS